MSSPEKKSFYLPELDVLRALAFLAVFISHWIPQSLDYYLEHHVPLVVARAAVALSSSGANGVMLFFCLSSYLITTLLIREIETRGQIHVRAFYMRRVLRIWPLYLTFIVIAAVVPFLDPEQHFGWKEILAFVFFGGNWIWALHHPVETVALPLWSISVEEQFYLCWPWLVRRATRRGIRNTALALFGLSALNRLLVITQVLHVDLWHNTFTQLDAIGLGALLAIGAGAQLEALKVRARARLICGAIVGVYIASVYAAPTDASWSNLVHFPFVALCCAMILFSTIGAELDRSSRLVRVLLYLGQISYGLYVIHFFAFYLVKKLIDHLPMKLNFAVAFVGRGAAAMLLTIVLATLSYRYIERPFLRFKPR